MSCRSRFAALRCAVGTRAAVLIATAWLAMDGLGGGPAASRATFAAEPAAARPAVRLRISPERILLGGANRSQQVLVTAESDSGSEFDATHECAIASADPTVAVAEGSVISGLKDGSTELIVRFGALERRLPVDVSGFGAYPPIDFVNDVV